MTVSSTSAKAGPTAGNSVATSFPFDFKVFAAADLQVVLADVASGAETILTLDSDYSVTLNPDQDNDPGGSVTYPLSGSAMTNASTLTIVADLDVTQPTDITNGGGFYADVVEKMVDRTVMLVRQVSETVSRALKLAVSTPDGVSADLPVPVANNVLGWNADGTGFKNFAPVDNTLLSAALAASTGGSRVGTADGGTVATSLESKLNRVVDTVADMAALNPSQYTRAFVLGHSAALDGGNAAYRYKPDGGTANGGSIVASTFASATGVWEIVDQYSLRVEFFGAKGDGSFDCTNAVLAAVAALRRNAVDILDNIGGTTITAYSSGVVEFGPGVFVVSADALQFTQDLGLTLRGKGSRRTNNAVRAATTLLVSGTSDGFGIQFSGNGARAARIEDMDICYADASFTGDVIDSLNCPGLILDRAFVGTFGLTGATRIQTARSLVRATYDEFHHFKDTVFDGAIDGWWSDDVRALNANDFGGSVTQFDNCLFYDFTGKPLRHDGNRTRVNVALKNTSVNPIQVNCVRGIDLTNVEGLTIDGGVCAGSVDKYATTEWLRLSNVTGKVSALCLDDNSKAGTLDGMLELTGNRVYCTDGFTLTGGVITSRANEFSKGTNGYILSPTYDLCVDLGPELFKAAITTSYYVPADSTLLSGRINYNQAGDSSASKFSNASPRVQIRNIDEKQVSVPDAAFVPSKIDSGRIFIATGTSSQTFTLPQPSPGLKFTIRKASTVGMRVDASVTGQLYVGTGGAKTSVIAAASDVGGVAIFEAYGTTAWLVTLSGTWALS